MQTINFPRPSKETGISTRSAILAILLASGFSAYGGYQYASGKGDRASNTDNDIVCVVAEDDDCRGMEKNMSSADDGLGQFGCSGLSDEEAVELGKKLKHGRGMAFRDRIIKEYGLTDEVGIADLENAALRGYVKESEMIYDGDSIMLKLEDDYGNEEIVRFSKSGGSFPELDDCQVEGVGGEGGAEEVDLPERDNKILYI